MIEEYCSNYCNQFTIGNQEDASEFYIHVAASIDSNNNIFPSEKLYDIKVKQYLCCLECDKRSETNENDNKCLYLGLNTSKVNGNSTVMDLINNYFEDKLLHEYGCSCKSLTSTIARKVVNRLSLISFFLKRYKGNPKTTKCRNYVFPSQEINLNNHMATNGSTLSTVFSR